MTTDVVGLRFVNEGLDDSLRGLQRYEQSVGRTARGMKVVADQSNQSAKSLDRLNRDVLRAENEMRRLAQAMQRGAVTGAQFQGEVNRIAARLRNLGLDRAQAETMKFARAQAELARETQQAGNAIAQHGTQVQTAMRGQAAATMFASRAQNASGMAMQQVGYQVGDFLVQVQSGTNALVAFGQQATQLVGVLPMMGSFMGLSGTALIGLSAGLGIAIPLVTALGAMWMRTSGNVADAVDDLERLSDVLSGLKDTQDLLSLSTSELAEKYGDAADAVREYALVEAQLKAALARSALKDAIDVANAAVDSYTQATRVLDEFGESFDISDNLRQIQRDFGLVGNEAQLLRSSLELLTTSLTFEDQQFALDNLLSNFDRLGVSLQDVPKPIADMILRLIEANRTAEETEQIIAALEGGLGDSERAANGLADGMDRVGERARAAAQGVMGILAALRSTMAELRAQEAGIAAAQRAAGRGMSESDVRIVQAGATAEAELAALGVEGPELSAGVAQAQAAERLRLQNEERQRAIFEGFAVSGGGGGGGGGGGAPREQEDYLKNLLLEAEHKRRLVGLTEEQTRRQELLFDLEKRKLPIDEERIEQIIRVEAETRALMALEEQRMQLMQTVEGHIENAFMSFVQGSATVEEAFKGMLRNIILAIYQQQVAEPAARAVGGLLGKVIPALFSANGNVFSGGAHVTAYANGGVVGSPTMFQHSGGLGVMGEAGPEAIMPLKRGSDGKLGVQMQGGGGGDTINVRQYFQLSANGDESVRRIVRQEAPRMAEMAKSAVVDAKRRGGSYGRSF